LQVSKGRESQSNPVWGWAIAKAIVELHGGSISAENNAGKGSTIKIKFPK
jgi:signal transduction histidine kinase